MSPAASLQAHQRDIVTQRRQQEALRYLSRHGYAEAAALPAPDPGTDLVVVIPALAEPDLVATLDSLAAAARPPGAVEVIVVVNDSSAASARTRQLTTRSLAEAREWARRHEAAGFATHVLDWRGLPAAHAGVGLARKLGLDTGLGRLAATRSGRGLLVSLDADCRVAPDYLVSIDNFFARHPAAVAASIRFEHPVDAADAELAEAMVDYELHLRCYRHGLGWAGSRYARYTVGSAIVVRSEIYAQEGGMNRRAAGEDFYFLNKLIKRGPVGEINDTAVFPSARVSDRVPFGTGAALGKSDHRPIVTYAPAVYRELAQFIRETERVLVEGLPCPAAYRPFLDGMRFDAWCENARANAASRAALRKHLHRWLDAFRTLKFVHWLSDERYPRVAPAAAARDLLAWLDLDPVGSPRELLERLRALDRDP